MANKKWIVEEDLDFEIDEFEYDTFEADPFIYDEFKIDECADVKEAYDESVRENESDFYKHWS